MNHYLPEPYYPKEPNKIRNFSIVFQGLTFFAIGDSCEIYLALFPPSFEDNNGDTNCEKETMSTSKIKLTVQTCL